MMLQLFEWMSEFLGDNPFAHDFVLTMSVGEEGEQDFQELSMRVKDGSYTAHVRMFDMGNHYDFEHVDTQPQEALAGLLGKLPGWAKK